MSTPEQRRKWREYKQKSRTTPVEVPVFAAAYQITKVSTLPTKLTENRVIIDNPEAVSPGLRLNPKAWAAWEKEKE